MTPFALFLDIDGTLTVENQVIPERNIVALRKARELGHKVFINTGRSYGNIPQKIFDQIEVDGVISGNGTALMLQGELIRTSFMPEDVIEKLAKRLFDSKEYWFVFEGFNHSYNAVGRGRKKADIEIPVTDYADFMLKRGDDPIQVLAVARSFPEEELISYKDDITYYKFGHYYDITVKGNNKADGMLSLLELMGIPQGNSMAFGDGDNDKNMLLKAGMGIAMANSQPELFDVADYITLTNIEGGVGAAIEKFLLKGE